MANQPLDQNEHSTATNQCAGSSSDGADFQIPNLTATTLAFGSCHKISYVNDENSTIWDTIGETLHPDAFLWTGDAIYAPTKGLASLETLQSQYDNMLTNETIGYSKFLASSSFLHGGIHGTWDDHDYGGNDYGIEMPQRHSRKHLFLDFLNVHKRQRRNRNGVYHSVTFGSSPHKIKIIFLDTRWGREAHCIPSLGTTSLPLGSPLACITRWITAGLAIPFFLPEGWCTDGRVLEEEQWEWLEGQLKGSDAQVHVVVSSIQVLTTNPVVESWGHFPRERGRLLRILNGVEGGVGSGGVVEGLVLLSGDVHHAEILDASANVGGVPLSNGARRTSLDWRREGKLLEVTSSGLTHSCTGPFYGKLCAPILNTFHTHRFRSSNDDEDNDDEIPPYYYTGKNFGSIHIDWGSGNEGGKDGGEEESSTQRRPSMRISIHDQDGKEVLTTGSHPLGAYASRMSDDELTFVAGCIDGHLLPYLVKVTFMLLFLGMSCRYRTRYRKLIL